MDEQMPPRVQKFRYMLSELNDHYDMRVRRNEQQDYIHFKIWFGGLLTELKTNVNMEGDVLHGMIQFHVREDTGQSEVESMLPQYVDISEIYDNDDGGSKVRAVLHSTRNGKPMDGQKYVERVRELKDAITNAEFVVLD